jgi:hypothetical protein
MNTDFIVFDDKKFSDLLRDIYINSKKKETQINGLIDSLKPLIKNVADASMMVPLIKEYLEVSVKNDEHLVRLASIVQRLLIAADKGDKDTGGLTDAERKQLLDEAQDLLDNSK